MFVVCVGSCRLWSFEVCCAWHKVMENDSACESLAEDISCQDDTFVDPRVKVITVDILISVKQNTLELCGFGYELMPYSLLVIFLLKSISCLACLLWYVSTELVHHTVPYSVWLDGLLFDASYSEDYQTIANSLLKVKWLVIRPLNLTLAIVVCNILQWLKLWTNNVTMPPAPGFIGFLKYRGEEHTFSSCQ